MRKLEKYIRDSLQQGYDVYAIRNHLIRSGYSMQDVDKAVDVSMRPAVRHEIHLGKSTLITLAAMMIVALVSTSVFWLVNRSASPEQLLDMETYASVTQLYPGDTLDFTTSLFSLGSKKRYDVQITHKLISRTTGDTISEKTETVGIETRASKSTRLLIPPDAEPGTYDLRSTAVYGSEKTQAQIPIRIVPEGVTTTTIVTTTTNRIATTTQRTLTTRPSSPSSFQSQPSFQVLENIRQISLTDPERAGKECEKIEDGNVRSQCWSNLAEVTKNPDNCRKAENDRTKDRCLSKVAELRDESSICREISVNDRRDSCLMNFVLKGEYALCDQISNSYLASSCERLRQVNQ